MSVEIDPVELGFHRPFTSEVSQTLKIKNPNHTPVAFKVKTTAPKQYCVRPNSGRIEPGKEVEVNVLLQAMKQEPPLDAKCKDKFQVQSVAVTADKEFTNINAIWQHVDEAEKSSVQDKKIRVVFLPAAGTAPTLTPRREINGVSHPASPPDTAPPAYRSPSPEESFTPQTTTRTSPAITASTVHSKGSSSPLGEVNASANNPSAITTARETVTSASSAVVAAIPTSVEELKAQLAEAQATIAAYGKEGGLRMRKAVVTTGEDGSVDTPVLRQQVSQGVPLQIVAALCLISFLLAYLFF